MAEAPPKKRLLVDPKQKAAELERRKRLFDGLASYIRKNGGWLVSAPGEKWLRVEAPQGSELADKLYDLGYDLKHSGSNTRATANGFLPVNCFTFTIPPEK